MAPKESEERFKVLIETTSDWIWEVDNTGVYTYSNPKVKDMLGYEVDDVIGKTAFDFMSPEEARKMLILFQTAIEMKEPIISLRNNCIHKDGYIVTLETSGVPFFDNDGTLIGYRGIDRDITEKLEAERKLKESEEKYRTLTEQSFLGIAILQDDIIQYVNNQLANIFGYTVEDIMAWEKGGFLNIIYPEDRKLVGEQAKKKQIGESDILNQYQFRGIKKNGDILWLEVFSKSINYRGRPADFATIHDITDKKISEQKIRDSEEKFRGLYEEAPIAYFSIGPEGSILRSNKAAERLLGFTNEEFLKMKVLDLYSDSNQGLEKAKNLFSKFLDGEPIKDVELEMKNKQRDIIWVSLSVKPIFNPEGNVVESRSMVLDITDRKIAQEEVKSSYKKLEELEYIINNSPGVGFLWKNSEGWPVEFVSENVTQFGYTPEDFYSGKVIFGEIIHPDDLERVSEEVNNYSNEDVNTFVQEYRIITKSGESRWLDDRSWIRRDSNRNITHYQGIVLDITDRKIAEGALKQSENKYKKAYDRANFYKDLFAHDMNNILQVINSSAELISFQLGESEKSKNISNIASIIRKQVKRGAKLVSNVRTLSEIEDEEIITKKVKINNFLKNAITFVNRAYEGRNIEIVWENVDEEHFTHANELLQDVFENVLINGIKYNENPDIEISIKFGKQVVESKAYTKIEFIDNGIGVSDERKEVIFSSGNRELKGSKGMGLGLSLVSKILTIFKGEIWVEDKIKGDYTRGSNFIILLPET